MDINDIRAVFTVLAVILFSGIVWWAYSDRRKLDYDEAARLPLDDDLPMTPLASSGAATASFGGESKLERKSS